jgi:hypothetical protein
MNGVIRIFTAAALASGLLAGPAFAQFKGQKEPNPLAQEEEERHKQNIEIDKQYNAMRRHTQDNAATPTKVDPWSNMRTPTDTAKR